MANVNDLDDHIDDVAGDALTTGGTLLAVLGFVCAIAGGLVSLGTPNFALVWVFAALSGFMGLGLRVVGRRKWFRGNAGIALGLLLTTPPSVFFVVDAVIDPTRAFGAAISPGSFLYAFLIVITGFLLRPRVSMAAGWSAGVQMCLTYWWAQGPIVAGAAGAMHAERISSASGWVFKGVMTVGVGYAVAGICSVARKLATRVATEERDAAVVKKLFGQFVSKSVRDKILRDGAGLQSERREVAVLFADVRNFTTLSEGTDPQDIVDRLNIYFDRMVQAIEAEGGVVDKFIGDAVMATFGGVLTVDNPSASAVRAARSMRAALVTLNAEWAQQGLPVLDNGVGVAFGVVIEGPLGSERRREFTVIGDTVNTASRVEGLTKELGQHVLFTRAVYDRLGDDDKATSVAVGHAHVKGKAIELELFGVVP
ncbi:MAG: adenylate/guanylate cyclase domain-containing protein [Deltaproteobacteria bacterium]|nr:adenylate/guanylate cyclase domain-containing protein [Deltaproteobacteria bacterium]